MASAIIDYREELPPVCARCGAAATVKVERVFRHQEGASILMPFFFGLVGLLVYLARPRRDHWLVMDVPFCDRHKNSWRRKEVVGWCTFLSVLGMVLALCLIVGVFQGSRLGGVILGGCIFGVLGGAFATFWVSALFELFTVRLKVVDPSHVKCVGIAEEFANQIETLRRIRTAEASVPLARAVDDDNPWTGLNTDPLEKLG